MNDFTHSVAAALALIGGLDAELLGIVWLSLRVSLTAILPRVICRQDRRNPANPLRRFYHGTIKL